MIRCAAAVLAVGLTVPVGGLAACQSQVETTGTNSLTIGIKDLTGAQGSQLNAELSKNVDYLQEVPTWTMFALTVPSTPFSSADTLDGLPEGEFDLLVQAGSPQKSTGAPVKGQGCELSFLLGKDERLQITIDGLNPFVGDRGYGPCRATLTRTPAAPVQTD